MQMTLMNNFYSWAKTILFSNAQPHNTYVSSESSGNGDSSYSHIVMGTLISTTGDRILQFLTQHSYSESGENSNAISLGYFNNSAVSGYDYTYFKVGSNNEETTTDMIELNSIINENIVYNISATHTSENLVFNLSIDNVGTEEMIIGEIGLYKSLTGEAMYNVLLGRAVFTTPIIIMPGKSRTIQINVGLI